MEGQGRKKDDQTSKTTKETQDENKAILNTMVKLLIQQTEATTKLGTYVQKMYEGMETLITSIKVQEQIGKDLKKVTETCLADVRTLSEKIEATRQNTEARANMIQRTEPRAGITSEHRGHKMLSLQQNRPLAI
ncbi:uncharacterized protein [Linepithema humile]|uniref:uncharacterized protein isoform X2 n=1 Tax=Linepithema humile TaxID=83485 RepID=UPI00351DE605